MRKLLLYLGNWSQHRLRLVLLALPFLFFILLVLTGGSQRLLAPLEDAYYDVRLRLLMPQTRADNIVIVDVDEKSLAEQGQWPWPRIEIAKLVEEIFSLEATALGVDMVLAEPDKSSGLSVLLALAHDEVFDSPEFLSKLQELSPLLDYDRLLAQTLSQYPVALGYYFTSDGNGRQSGLLPSPVLSEFELQGAQIQASSWDGYGANLPIFSLAAPNAGFFNSLNSRDGAVRAVPLLAEFKGNYYESLPLAVLRLASQLPEVEPGWAASATASAARLSSVRLRYKHGAAAAIPVDERAAVLVPYRGRGGPQGGSFAYYSASDVMHKRLPAESFRGKLVLLGSSAPGLLDLRATPVGEAYPGVEVHANVLAGMLEGRIPQKPSFTEVYELGLLLVLGVLLLALPPSLSLPRSLLVVAGLSLLVMALNSLLFLRWNWVLPASSPLLLLWSMGLIHIFCGYVLASRAKSELARLFGSYVPSELVEVMVKDPENYNMEARNEELTVMFCDVRGFTQLAENINPLRVQQLLNAVFGHLNQIIKRHGGTIDKYMGDCVMAFWGAPLPVADHVRQAVSAAHEISASVEVLNNYLREKKLLHPSQGRVELSIALNTGVMCVGNMGTELRQAYTVIGDEVNLAARLEPLSRVYGVDIIVSAKTCARAPWWVWQELDDVYTKGRVTRERIFTPVAKQDEMTPELGAELQLWDQFLAAYRAQQLERAESLLKGLQQMRANSSIYKLYAKRLIKIKENGFLMFSHSDPAAEPLDTHY